MTKIRIIDAAGAAHDIEPETGQSLMQAVRGAGIGGVVAECNGNAACATCHVYLDEQSAAKLTPPGEHEAEMLEFTAAAALPTSRLSCQVPITEALSGMIVTIPETQV